MANKKKRRYKKRKKEKFGCSYTAVMLLLAVVLFYIVKFEPEFIKVSAPELSDASGEAEVHFIDVGQGDSSLIRLPEDDGGYINILIDSGEKSYGDEVENYLYSIGVYELDAVIVTHPHSDHMGSMAMIIEEFPIGKFYMSSIPENIVPTTNTYESMLDALDEKGLKITTIGSGDNLSELTNSVSGASIKVLSPRLDNDFDDLNDVSLIIKLNYGSTSFLFTGDAELGAYKEIRGSIGRVNVLKIGHHGSSNATDEALLAETYPEYAVISYGRDNDYGHPHDRVIDLLNKYQITMIRTANFGNIIFTSDGENLSVA